MYNQEDHPQLRLFVLGDIHYQESHEDDWREILDDINALKPDCVLAVGDLTGGIDTGTSKGMAAATRMLAGLHAPWQTVIGNHDLQAEEFASDEAAVASFLSFCGRERPWFRYDVGPITIIGLSNTRWRLNTVNHNEIFYSEEQLEWARNEIASIPDRPVFVLAHVPPIGSGLMVMGELHASVGNAYANQNYVPNSVIRLVRENPNVLMWFSGHNHLGQHYRDAISMRLGTHFVHVGTANRHQSRDRYLHSRVIDIHEDRLLVRTFDHTLRRIEEHLDHCESSSLGRLIEYRRVTHVSRFIAADPATMRQGPGPQAPRLSDHRFAFLSDAHIIGRPYPCQRRVLSWATQQVFANTVKTLVFGGDLTHHASAEEAKEFIHFLSIHSCPTLYLPGNNETTDIDLGPDGKRFTFVKAVTRLSEWPGHAFALATTSGEDTTRAIEELARQLPESGTVLVLAHFPPVAEESVLNLLSKPGLSIEWVCGHQHESKDYRHGPVSVHVCAGLDPIKVRNGRPEVMICDWDGTRLAIQRHLVPPKYLRPSAAHRHIFGLAYRSTPAELLQTAIDQQVTALQFRWADVTGELSDEERRLIERFRKSNPQTFLSLHLPNFTVLDSGIDISEMIPCLEWAKAVGVDDFTIHLPSVPVSRVFGDDQSLHDTDWVQWCFAAYTELARQAIAMGAQLSMENVYNKSRVADGDEILSTRPWHLLNFVQEVRRRLIAEGHTAEQASKAGIIFDSGHAFRDPKVSKIHGLADWLQRIAPFLQLAHIHQTIPINGKMKNHLPIDSPCSERINHTGLLPAFAEVTKRPIPLLIEVRTREGALTSLRSLRLIEYGVYSEL